MVLPVYLGLGMVAVYGPGIQTAMSGLTPTLIGQSFKYGTIYQMNSVNDFRVGDSVMFRESDVQCRLATQNNLTYTVLEAARLVLTDIPR
jgi:hypothetical protein